VKRKVLATLAALAMVFAITGTALASGPIGNCSSSGSNSYRSGEDTSIEHNDYAIFASIQVGASIQFSPCTINDNSGTNATSAHIGISNPLGGAWVEFGVIACNHTTNGAWPGFCDWSRHVFIERSGAFGLDYHMFDLGNIDTGAHDFKILFDIPLHKWYFYLDGVAVPGQSIDMGAGLDPSTADLTTYWQLETQDPGDGLGTQSVAANIGEQKFKNSTTWVYHDVGGSCDYADGQHHCVVNGSHAIYGYTVN